AGPASGRRRRLRSRLPSPPRSAPAHATAASRPAAPRACGGRGRGSRAQDTGGTASRLPQMALSQADRRDGGARRTTLASIAVAALLVALKLGAGLATESLGLISAGIESSGDVLAAVLTFFAVRLAGRPADPGHPYGHRRAENLGAIGEAGILIAGAVFVAIAAIKHLIEGGAAPTIRWYQFAVIGVALVLDVSRTTVSVMASRRYESPALGSNAWHFAADGLGSAAVLIGLLAAKAGVQQADSVAALLVAGIILAAAGRLIGVNANVLMDRTPDEARAEAE